MSDRAGRAERVARIARVVRLVVAESLSQAAAEGVVVLDDWTPEGELLYEWLVRALGEARVWRVASLASNVQGVHGAEAHLIAAARAGRDLAALLAHPGNKTALLLGGRLPRADLFPLGDAYASQVEVMAGGWSAPAEIEALARRAGGVATLDAALARLIDGREDAPTATAGLDTAAAGELRRLYEAGRQSRLRPRIVPKLGARTLGVDLFD